MIVSLIEQQIPDNQPLLKYHNPYNLTNCENQDRDY